MAAPVCAVGTIAPACPARTLPPRIETTGPLIEDVKCVSFAVNADVMTFELEILSNGAKWDEEVELISMPSTVTMQGRIAHL